MIRARSCLELPHGLELPNPLSADKPFYHVDLRTLYFEKRVIKCFRVPAPSQELILLAFQEEDWPTRLADPLPAHCLAARESTPSAA